MCVRGFSPLNGFMNEEDYASVVENAKTTDGTIFGLPIVMDTEREDINIGSKILMKCSPRFLQGTFDVASGMKVVRLL